MRRAQPCCIFTCTSSRTAAAFPAWRCWREAPSAAPPRPEKAFRPFSSFCVAVLAESHISVHTWPEKGFAAFDVFMCGDAEPRKALEVFKRAFEPGRVVVGEHKRGVI